MKLSRFAQLTIELIQEYARPVISTGPGLAQRERDIAKAERALREETAEAERLAAFNSRINETNRPKWPHETGDTCHCPTCKPLSSMIPVTLLCGHSRLSRADIPMGQWLRCDACDRMRQVMQKFGTTVREELKPRRPTAELDALRELKLRVEMLRTTILMGYHVHAYRDDISPMIQSVFNALSEVPK